MQKLGVAGNAGSVKEDAYSKMTMPQKISRTLGDIFVPIIPVLVATGLFMGLRGLLTNLGFELSPTLNILSQSFNWYSIYLFTSSCCLVNS